MLSFRSQPLANASEGGNYTVNGDFSMLGQTHPISFPARIKLQGSNLELEASFKLDRTKWGMTYAADPALGDHHILPEVAPLGLESLFVPKWQQV